MTREGTEVAGVPLSTRLLPPQLLVVGTTGCEADALGPEGGFVVSDSGGVEIVTNAQPEAPLALHEVHPLFDSLRGESGFRDALRASGLQASTRGPVPASTETA
jgi:hypothetical protein